MQTTRAETFLAIEERYLRVYIPEGEDPEAYAAAHFRPDDVLVFAFRNWKIGRTRLLFDRKPYVELTLEDTNTILVDHRA